MSQDENEKEAKNVGENLNTKHYPEGTPSAAEAQALYGGDDELNAVRVQLVEMFAWRQLFPWALWLT